MKAIDLIQTDMDPTQRWFPRCVENDMMANDCVKHFDGWCACIYMQEVCEKMKAHLIDRQTSRMLGG